MHAPEIAASGWVARAAKPIALAFLFVAALALVAQLVNPYPVDFVSFWAAGRLALDGNPAGAYDLAIHRAVEEQGTAMGGGMPFPYPPAFLALIAPFSPLPYAPAMICWVTATFAFYALALRRFAPDAGWMIAAFPPILSTAIIGQNGFLLCGLFAGGLTLLPKQPWLGGAMLGVLILKPQLGLVLPFVLLAVRDWRAIGGAAIGSLGILLFGAASFGLDSYAAWFDQAPLYTAIAAEGLSGWNKMASVYAALRLAGAGDLFALSAHILLAAAATVATCLVWRRTADLGARAGTLAAATVLASPYLYGYDTILLVLPFIWLAQTGGYRGMLALIWGLSFVTFLQNWTGGSPVNVAPLAAILLLVLIVRQVWRAESSVPSEARLIAAA